jgi:murein DD-endopeptidase MepM/ murein hydrolase activator NlpD
MSNIYVSAGSNVAKGSVIGKMGSTGRSTGTHLHFEIIKDGVKLSPLSILQ